MAFLRTSCLCSVQNVADCGETADPSCPSSEDGYASASLDGAGSRGDAGSADGGRAWDMSGVPVDYTFKVTPPCHPPHRGAMPQPRLRGDPNLHVARCRQSDWVTRFSNSLGVMPSQWRASLAEQSS